eukprot:m.187150 g.187150  ORF g.187150 m.187150 type:complete len:291 (+) comp18153_c0_seq1:159-1031(+)
MSTTGTPRSTDGTSTQGGTPLVLLARIDDVRDVASILRTVGFVDNATVCLTENGMKVVVEQAKTLQARVFLQKALFQEYLYVPDDPEIDQTEFNVPLDVLLECLGIFGSTACTSLRMTYAGYGSPLTLILEEGGIVTDCTIKTMEPGTPIDIDMRSCEIPSNIIMKSNWLAEVFSELDPSSEWLQFHVSPDKPYFRLETCGQAASAQIDCPKDSQEIESFTCQQVLVHRYRLKLLKPCEKALSLSSKISIRLNTRGFLSIQFLVEVGKQAVFIEFLCLPEEDDYDEDEPL